MADYISQIALPNNVTYDLKDAAALSKSGGILTGGLEIKGHIAGDGSTTTGHGLYGGGMYHNAYNNIILHGDASTGSSGIAFVSDKVSADGTITNRNAPSDRAFIQYHACGVTTATTEGTNPTLASGSEEAGRFVIGIGNDSGDKIILQAPGTADIIHQIGVNSYPIPHTTNTNGSVGGTTTPVYVDAGVIKAGTALGGAAYKAENYYALSGHNHDSTYSYTHLSDYDFTDTQPLSKYVTFDKSRPTGAPKEEWYNGFISSHSNYHASYIINGHTNQNEWYVGHGIWREANTPHATAPTWYLLAHSGNVSTGDNNGQVKIAGVNISVKGLGSAAYTETSTYATSSHNHNASDINAGILNTARLPDDVVKKRTGLSASTTETDLFSLIPGMYDHTSSGVDNALPTGYGTILNIAGSYYYGALIAAETNNSLYYRAYYYQDDEHEQWRGKWQIVAHTDAGTAKGDTKKPIYINARGEIQEGDTLKNLAYKDSLTSSDIPDNAANTTGNAATSTSSKYLYPFNDGTNNSGTTDIQILTTLQADDNIPRSKPFGVLLQHGNHSVGFGYFYPKSSQYGGWYIANYNGPSYIGLNNGTWKSYTFLTNQNYTSYAVAKTAGVTAVTWDSTNKKITKTINGTTSDVVTAETLKAAINITAADLDLSKAMRFIGVATVAITDGSTTDPVISGYSTKTAGDVIIDKDSSREYVWSTTGKWELLGGDSSYKVTQTAVTTATAETTEDTVFVSSVTQNENGEITVKTRPLDTSGTWEGNAVTATTASNLSAKPSFAASGNKITLTAGGKTSDAFTVPYATSAGSATTATYIKCTDTRNTALNPTDLTAAQGVRFDFKAKDTIGLTATDYYAGVMSFRPYASNSNWSGGNAHQIAFNSEGLHWRNGSASWGNWYQILDSNNTAAGSNNAATLTWNTTYTIAKINDTDIKFTTMAKPSYAFTDLTAHPTTLSGYGITDAASSNHSHTLKIGNKSLSVSTNEQEWTVHDILYNANIIQQSTSWDIITPGIYAVTNSSHDGSGHPGSTTGQTAPYAYGHLIVTRANGYGAAQFYISHVASGPKAANKGIRYRSGWNVDNTNKTEAERWQEWATILDDKNFNLYAPTLTGTGASGTWTIDISGNAATATQIKDDAPNTTAQFYRGDNTWSDTISGGTLKITNNSNTLTIGSTNSTQCHFSNSLNIPFYFNNSIELSGSLGTADHPANALYIGAQDDRSIYFVGTNTTDAILTFLDNTIDNAGNGIKIEGSTAVLGAGKSATHLPVDANTGTLFLLSDGVVNIEAGGSTISNRIGIQITSAGNIIPVKAEAANTNAQDLGAVGNVWANVFATNFIGALDGNATSADKFSTARKLGVALGSTTAVTFNGSTDQLSIPVSGTLAVRHGGTGATSFTANSLIISGATTTSALTTRAIKNMIAVSHLGWTTATAGIEIPTVNTLAYWNGQFKDGSSNLQYCKLGKFGDMATKTATDYVLRAGDTMLGMLTIKGLKGTTNVDYGTALPTSGTTGQIFFQLSDPYYEIPAGGTTGQVLMKHSDSNRDVYWSTPRAGGILRPDTTTKYYVAGSSLTVENTNPALFNTSIYVENNVLFGAAWNDYAEYRQTIEIIEPGRCVIEDGTDALHLSGARMQAGAEIVSDTYGFAIGQTEKCNTPIAVTGRVLAYPYDDLDKYKPGTPVCSGPEGTVSAMTEEEARQYPWLIIGTVSAIPTYEEWGTNHIKINGRIWIRIR